MATATAKKARSADAPIKKTVSPLFLDQHGELDEGGGLIECYAEDIGSIRLYRHPKDPKKQRTMVSEEDSWLDGWKFEDDGVTPDMDTVTMFEIDPYTTTQKDIEKQFGEGRYYIDASWGPDVPDKNGLIRGAHYSFVCEGPKKHRGKVITEKKSASPNGPAKPAGEENDEPETPEEIIDRLETEATERDEKIEALEKMFAEKFSERAAPPTPSPMGQMRETFEVMNAMGIGPQTSGASVQVQREQAWQDQMAAIRREQADRERILQGELSQTRSAAEALLTSVRSTLANEASAKNVAQETRLSTLLSEMSAMRTASMTEMGAIHQAHRDDLSRRDQAQRDDLNRRETAHEAAIAEVKAQRTRLETQLSEFRQSSDTKVSELTALLNGHKLLEMQAGLEKRIETEKTARIEKEFAEIKAERDHFKMLNSEQNETIEVMRRNLHTPTHAGDSEGISGFTIPRVVWKVLLPALPMIAMLLYKFFSDSGRPMPKEASEWFAKQARDADIPGADAWAQANYAEAAEQERLRREKEWNDSEHERLRREEVSRAAATDAARAESQRVAEAARVEAARVEAMANERREAEKAAAVLVEKQVEAARVEVARAEAARAEATRVEVARVDAERAAEALRVADAERATRAAYERARGGTPVGTSAAAPAGTTDNPIVTPPPAEASNGAE